MNLREMTKETLQTFTPEGQLEFTLLAGIDNLLSRVKDIQGDEAFIYVQAKNYLKAKLEDLMRKEQFMARAKAEQAKKAAEAPVVTQAKKDVLALVNEQAKVQGLVETPKPALTLVKTTEEPTKAV